MVKGIKAKDIRDFEKCVAKLNAIMDRIRTYRPNAHIYATPGELNLMSNVVENCSAQEEQSQLLVTSAALDKLEAGDW